MKMRRSYLLPLIGLLGFLANYVVYAIVSTRTNHADFGNFSVALSTAYLLTQIFLFGQQTLISAYTKEYNADKNSESGAGNLVKWIVHNSIRALSILAAGIAIYIFVIWWFYNIPLRSIIAMHPSHLTIFFVPVIAGAILLRSILLSHKKTMSAIIPMRVIYPLFLGFLILFLYKEQGNLHIETIIGLYFISYICALLIQLCAIPSILPLENSKNHNEYIEQKWVKSAYTYGGSNLASALAPLIPLYTLEAIAPESSVGHYSIIIAIVSIFSTILGPLQQKFANQVSLSLEKGIAYANSDFRKLNKQKLAVISLSYIIVFNFSKQILLHFGTNNEFLEPILMYSLASYAISAAFTGTASTLIYSLSHRGIVIFRSCSILSVLVLSVGLIPQYGVVGAISAYIIPNIIQSVFATIYLQRKKGILTLSL